MKHRLKPKLLGEMAITSYADDITLMAESEEELKSFLMMVQEESEKAGLKTNIQKMKVMASGLITSWQIDGEKITNLDWLLKKNRYITLPTKICIVKLLFFQ